MPASADYLTKYLTASNSISSGTNGDYDRDSTRPKKRRKKEKAPNETTSLLIADDDDDLLLSSNKKQSRQEEDDEGPTILESKFRTAEFRKKKSSNWQNLDNTNVTSGETGSAEDEADRILADAAAESDFRRQDQEMEDAPAIVETTQDADGGPRMESGVRAGLQTAADTAALLAAEEAAKEKDLAAKRMSKKERRGNDNIPVEEETIYRDATGRRIDVSIRRAEARAAEVEKLRQEKRERENATGEIQRQQKEERKKELDDAKFLTLGRTADDEEMNEHLKEVVRWDDPMAEYMAQKRAEESVKGGNHQPRTVEVTGSVKTKRKEYQGAAPPNRYGIKPGWRWDGVDRGNGFEKEWFQARGRKSRYESLEYQWQMDE